MSAIGVSGSEGVFTWTLGDIDIVYINDGKLGDPRHILAGATHEEIVSIFEGAKPPVAPDVSIGAFLIRGYDRSILVDTGCGNQMHPTAGQLARNLDKAGIDPLSIDTVLLTHAHLDHVGGLLDEEGRKRFPLADIRLHKADIDMFIDRPVDPTWPKPVQASLDLIRTALLPYRQAIVPFESGEIMPGIQAIALPGHTPGHTGFRIRAPESPVFLWGDVTHVPEVQIGRPDIGVIFDFDAAAAHQSRLKALAMAADEHLLTGGMHFQAPGLGRIIRREHQYLLTPASE
jgi:glyoxylase-like metal-dependent hydrolase (beta-lactamase superfamily II)